MKPSARGRGPTLSPARVRRISAELLRIGERDQQLRLALDQAVARKARSDRLRRLEQQIEESDRLHQTALRKLVREIGWPAQSVFGEQVARAAFVLVLHLPSLELQKLCLEAMKRAFRRGEVLAFHLAYLWDRIAITEGRAQSFGTHLVRLEHGEWAALPIRDPDRVDQRRARYGLPPLEEYAAVEERRWQRTQRWLAGRRKQP